MWIRGVYHVLSEYPLHLGKRGAQEQFPHYSSIENINRHSVMTAVPITSVDRQRLLQDIDDNGVSRLSEVADRMGSTRTELYHPLMELVERGEVAVFPIGDTVQVRRE